MAKLQGKYICVCVCVCTIYVCIYRHTYFFSGALLPKEINLKTGVDRGPAVKDHRKKEST